MWRKVSQSKYDCNNLHDVTNYRSTNSSFWKAIVKLVPNLFSSSSWIVGDGRDINAWKDNWMEHGSCVINYILQIP